MESATAPPGKPRRLRPGPGLGRRGWDGRSANPSPTLARGPRDARPGEAGRRPPRAPPLPAPVPPTPHGGPHTVGAEGPGARGADKGGGGGRAILSRGLDARPFIRARGPRGPRPSPALGPPPAPPRVHLPPPAPATCPARRLRTARGRKQRERARRGAASHFPVKTGPPDSRAVVAAPRTAPLGSGLTPPKAGGRASSFHRPPSPRRYRTPTPEPPGKRRPRLDVPREAGRPHPRQTRRLCSRGPAAGPAREGPGCRPGPAQGSDPGPRPESRRDPAPHPGP